MIYNKYAKCPKCGESYVSTKYEEHDRLGEVMKRVCSECRYTWLEDTLDSQESKEFVDKQLVK